MKFFFVLGSVNSAISSSQTSVDDDVSKSVLNQDEEVAMNESQQNEDEDEIVVDDMDTTVNTGNEPDGSTDNEEDEEDEPRTVVKSSVPAKNNDSYGKRGRRQRQRTNLGSGGGKSLGNQDSSILINGKRYYRESIFELILVDLVFIEVHHRTYIRV